MYAVCVYEINVKFHITTINYSVCMSAKCNIICIVRAWWEVTEFRFTLDMLLQATKTILDYNFISQACPTIDTC